MSSLRSIALAALVIGAGCSGSGYEGASLVPAKGQVTMDGNPLAGATIAIYPIGETASPGSYAVSDEQGNYELRTGNNEDGAPAGQYKVTVSKLVMEDGSPIPPDAETIAELETKDIVPMQFRDPMQTPLQMTIPEGGAEGLDLQLTGGGQ